jgi:ribosome modulation factor
MTATFGTAVVVDPYRQGVRAFRDGQPDDTCPYPSRGITSNARTAWMQGFYDTRMSEFLSRIEKKYGRTAG